MYVQVSWADHHFSVSLGPFSWARLAVVTFRLPEAPDISGCTKEQGPQKMIQVIQA